MTKFDEFLELLRQYFFRHELNISALSTLHECSENSSDGVYLYNGKELSVINMDVVSKDGYKVAKKAKTKDSQVSTADSFVINHSNEWYFIEFKDSKINAASDGVKRSVLKKAYENWYMILDILYSMKDTLLLSGFDFSNPVEFAKKHVHYILVCRLEKNAEMYMQIKNHALLGETYTPPFMQRIKDYLFKDAYIFTEVELERNFVEKFVYE